MKALVSLIAVLLLVLIAYAGVAAANLRFLFGVIIRMQRSSCSSAG
jgi:hypothetical protein